MKKIDTLETDISIRVVPRSSRNEIVGEENGSLKIKLTAPPVEGKANKALRGLLAKRLGVPKGGLEIVAGEKSRTKTVRIRGLSREEVAGRLGMEDSS
jgi:uncharacterized protein